MRAGFYGTYDPQFVSYPYVLGIALATFVVGGLPAAPARELPDRAVSARRRRVSVITPVWNAAATLAAAVASVRAQSLPDWEMLIVDDGSTDGCRALAERLAAEEPRIRLLGWAANRGAAAARNAGIRAARGRFIAFLDADDLWRPEKLAVQIGYMERDGRALQLRRLPPDRRRRPAARGGARCRRGSTMRGCLRGNVIPCQTAVYDRLHYGRVEMPDLRRRQDYGLWLTLLARGGEAHGLPRGAGRLPGAAGLALARTGWPPPRATWRVYREVAGLGRARAGYCLAHNLARGVAKRLGIGASAVTGVRAIADRARRSPAWSRAPRACRDVRNWTPGNGMIWFESFATDPEGRSGRPRQRALTAARARRRRAAGRSRRARPPRGGSAPRPRPAGGASGCGAAQVGAGVGERRGEGAQESRRGGGAGGRRRSGRP